LSVNGLKLPAPVLRAGVKYSNGKPERNSFFEKFSLYLLRFEKAVEHLLKTGANMFPSDEQILAQSLISAKKPKSWQGYCSEQPLQMKSIMVTYPGFQSLPKGLKQMLVESERFFFEEETTFIRREGKPPSPFLTNMHRLAVEPKVSQSWSN